MKEKYYFGGSVQDKLRQHYQRTEKTTEKVKVADVRSGVKVDQSFHHTNRSENTIKAAPGLSTAILPAGPVSPAPTQQSQEELAGCRSLQSAYLHTLRAPR